MSIASVSLDDKYRLERGTVFLTGMQALARLPMLQHELDRRAGLHTAVQPALDVIPARQDR